MSEKCPINITGGHSWCPCSMTICKCGLEICAYCDESRPMKSERSSTEGDA